ncbi:hypothetical protein KUCAC02_010172, partial [Chaenocephalus aceratus]
NESPVLSLMADPDPSLPLQHHPAQRIMASYTHISNEQDSPFSAQPIPLALRWHNPCHIVTLQSSDANGCAANPAAGKSGPVPIPALPDSRTAAPCSGMPTMHQGSDGEQSGCWWEDCMLKWTLQERAGGDMSVKRQTFDPALKQSKVWRVDAEPVYSAL